MTPAQDLTALADKLDELERSLDTIEDETCEGEDWMDYAGWEERYKARVSEAQDAFIHAARVALPQITTALREAARMREVEGAVAFVRRLASYDNASETAANWSAINDDDCDPDFEGGYDAVIEQAREVVAKLDRAALEGPHGA